MQKLSAFCLIAIWVLVGCGCGDTGTGNTADTDADSGTDSIRDTDADAGSDGSTGPLTAAIAASRTTCVSPCTVVFSAESTTDTRRDAVSTWQDFGYRFDFDDPDSGSFATTGASKNTQIGGPMASHTFICAENQCEYNVGVRAQTPEGEYDDAFVTITVDTPEYRFSASDTVCVSTSGTFTDCPDGAVQMTSLPNIGNYSGKRILLRRGETFGSICIGYGESNVLVEPFGSDAARPTVPAGEVIDVGVNDKCDAHNVTTAEADALNDVGLWVRDVTVTGLRVARVSFGMAYENIGLHDLDMDFALESSGGSISLTSSTGRCYNSDTLDCASVPFPYGAYVSDVTLNGADASPPGINIGAFDCPMMNWVTVIGTTARNSIEHNLRWQGQYRAFVGHSAFWGDHAANGKQKMTLRGCGITDLELTDARRGDTETWQNIDSLGNGPRSKYMVVADNTFGSTTSSATTAGNNGFKSGMQPQNASANEGLELGIFERNIYVDADGDSTRDIYLAGKDLLARTNTYAGGANDGCEDRSTNYAALSYSEDQPVEFKNEPNCDGEIPPAPEAPARK